MLTLILTILYLQTSESDLVDYEAVCSKENMVISEDFKRKVFEKDELKQILDIEVSIALPPEQWSKILEQILLVVLILGRWLLPKGTMSRDQFSQLMLVYTGMAADIAEIFEAFRESKVGIVPVTERNVTAMSSSS